MTVHANYALSDLAAWVFGHWLRVALVIAAVLALLVPGSLAQAGAAALTAEGHDAAQPAADLAHGKLFFVPSGAQVTIDVPRQAPDIAAALRAIADWHVAGGAFVNVRIAPGRYDLTTAIVIDHPDGRRIGLSAAIAAQPVRFAGFVSSVPAEGGASDITIRLDTTRGLALGDYLRVTKTAGEGAPAELQGLFPVIAIVGDAVTLRSRNRALALRGTALSSAEIFKPAVQIRILPGHPEHEFYGLDVQTALGMLNNVAIIGDGIHPYSSGVRVGDAAYLLTGTGGGTGGLSIANWGRNCLWAFRNATAITDGLTVSGCGTSGVIALQGGQIEAARSIATGSGYGFAAIDGGQVTCSGCQAVGNNTNFFAISGGVMVAPNSFAYGSSKGGTGYFAQAGGFIWAVGAEARRNQSGFYADAGRINAAGAKASENRSYQFFPSFNHEGTSGGRIFGAKASPPSVEGCGEGASASGTDMGGEIRPGPSVAHCRIGFRVAFTTPPNCSLTQKSGVPVKFDVDAEGITLGTPDRAIEGPLNFRCAGD